MRWIDFFSHLEHNFALDAHQPRESSPHGDRDDAHVLEMCLWAKAAKRQITVGVKSGDVFHVSPRAVGREWFSGLVGGEKGSGLVIPVTAVSWLEGDGVSPGDEIANPVTATLADVLTDMARRRATITIRTLQSDYVGVIANVGRDFCDVAGGPPSSSRAVRRFPVAAIVAVFQGSIAWG
jgi:hypothetical protein